MTVIVHMDGMGPDLRGRWRCRRRGHPFVTILSTATFTDGEKVAASAVARCACGRHTETIPDPVTERRAW